MRLSWLLVAPGQITLWISQLRDPVFDVVLKKMCHRNQPRADAVSGRGRSPEKGREKATPQKGLQGRAGAWRKGPAPCFFTVQCGDAVWSPRENGPDVGCAHWHPGKDPVSFPYCSMFISGIPLSKEAASSSSSCWFLLHQGRPLEGGSVLNRQMARRGPASAVSQQTGLSLTAAGDTRFSHSHSFLSKLIPAENNGSSALSWTLALVLRTQL